MNRWRIVWFLVLGNSLSACRMGECREPRELVPPKATPIPKRLENFGRTRVDDDYWLRERTDPRVIAYLDAENDYTDALMAHTKSLQRSLYDEIVGRIKQADSTAPVFDNGYHYYTLFKARYPLCFGGVWDRHGGSSLSQSRRSSPWPAKVFLPGSRLFAV